MIEQERSERLRDILDSDATHKLIISGPGTGKTYAFGRVLEEDPGNSLVITLINNLVDDMQHELGELADVRTFHSLSRMLLHVQPYDGISSRFHFFPQLSNVISEDSLVLGALGLIDRGFTREEFGRAFRLLAEDDGRVDFFIERANYYDAVGFDDSVYRVLSLFRNREEAVPTYHNVMVDEYQDFNELEVGVIASLESENRMLIVGDDDQAIYDFRQASPEHLRDKAADERYVRFPLPYCTRCTDVVISAADSVIGSAQNVGLLEGRLDKEFVCYVPDKQPDNEKYPTIQAVACSVHRKNAPYIPKYIESVLSNVDADEISQATAENYPLALVVGPGHYLDQIYDYLAARFANVLYRQRSDLSISVLDGLELLRERENSNLGWRILVELLDLSSLENVIELSAHNQRPMVDLLDGNFMRQQLARLDVINRAIADIDSISVEDISDLESAIGKSIGEIIHEIVGQSQDDDEEIQQTESDEEELQPSILLTNFSGSKGLSAAFTFVTGLEENTFPGNNQAPSDSEVSQFVVALTRTRKQCHLIHTRNFAGNWTEPSVFFEWIPDEICEVIDVNKDYFEAG